MAKPPRGAPPQPQPHEMLFRWTFSQREHAAGLLRAALPPALVSQLDLRTLRLEKGTYVDRALRNRQSDLLLSVRVRGKRLYFYLLIEHQRKVQPLMIVRLGIYMMRIWDEMLREHPDLKQVPPIVPLLIHHSKTGWTAATAFHEVVALDAALRPTVLPYIPGFTMRLVDLHDDQAENLVTEMLTALGQVVLWALSVAGDDARLEKEITRMSAALTAVLRAPNASAAFEVLLRYLAATHRRLRVEKIGEILENVAGPEAQEVIVTTLDEIELRGEKRGEKKGREEGRTQGRAEGLLEQLRARFGPVPAKVSAKVQAADEATLSRWAVRVLTEPTMDAVLTDKDQATKPARSRAPRKTPRRT